MNGIDISRPTFYKLASLRYFEKHERHITRFCKDNVLLLVFSGVLRFSINGEQMEVGEGEYYIQRKNTYQSGEIESDEPKYLYAHFDAEWTDSPDALPHRGNFNYDELFEIITEIDIASHHGYLYAEQEYLFLKLLLSLRQNTKKTTVAQKAADFIEKNLKNVYSLSDICDEFHYSKNYIIRIFKREFGVTPIQYINERKIKRAMYLLETTSKNIGIVSEECGYTDYAYFYKLFMRKTGDTPSAWRKKIQQSPLYRF